MNEFVSWATLGTFGGALAMVTVLTQFTKDLSFTKRIPTQVWSYILALSVMYPAMAFTGQLDLSMAFQTLFNAVIVSLGANGVHTGLQRILTKPDE